MKKIIILLFGLWSVTLLSQNAVSKAVPTGAISNTSATAACDGYDAAGASKRYVLMLGLSPSSLVPRDSVVRLGAGYATAIDIPFLITGLSPSTYYYYEFQVKNNSTGALIMQTTASRYFYTTANPVSASLTMNTSPQPFIGGGRLIVNTNNSGQSGTLVAYANESGYSGSGWQFTSTSKSLSGSFATTTDTLTFTGMGNNSVSGEIRFIPSNGGNISPLAFSFTPTTAVRPTVYGSPTVNYRYDTMQIVTYTNQSGGGNDSVKVDGFDSTNTLIFTRKMRVNDQLTTGVFTNYFNGISYPVGKLFTIRKTVWNAIGRDSVTTSQYRMLVAPAMNQVINGTPVIKARSVSLEIKLWNDNYTCAHRHGHKIAKHPYTDWTVRPVKNLVGNNVIVPINELNLDAGSSYRIISYDTTCSNTTSELIYDFVTPVGLAAPAIGSVTGYGGCAEVGINSFSVVPQPGDTSTVYLLTKDPSWSVWEIYDSVIITKQSNLSGFSIAVPALTTIDLGVQTKSKDGTLSVVSPTRQTSSDGGSGLIMRELISWTDTSATFEIFGNLECSSEATWKAKVFQKQGNLLILERDSRITRGADGNFRISPVTFGGLVPNTRYYLEVGISTKPGYWVGVDGGNREFSTNPKSTTGTSSVIYVVSTDAWSDDQPVIAYDLLGREFKGSKIQLKNKLQSQSDQIFLFTTERNGKYEVIKTTPASL